MVLVQTLEGALTLAEFSGCLQDAFQIAKNYRAKQFIKTVESRYEVMTPTDRRNIVDFIHSKEGGSLIYDLVISVTMTPSMYVNTALALIMANDLDYHLTKSEIDRFISATSGLTDRKVDFLTSLTKLEHSRTKSLFHTYFINNENFRHIEPFADLDELFIYTADFISRGLLLQETNPRRGMSFAPEPDANNWSINFSMSKTQRRYINLLSKAKEIYNA